MKLIILFLLEFNCIVLLSALFAVNDLTLNWVVFNCYYIVLVEAEGSNLIIFSSVYRRP